MVRAILLTIVLMSWVITTTAGAVEKPVSTKSKRARAVPRKQERVIERYTRVRIEGQPFMLWRRTKVLRLESMQVEVRNVGLTPAEKVRVYAALPGGKQVQLRGPQSLAVGERAPYSSGAKEMVYTRGQVQFRVACRNCRKD